MNPPPPSFPPSPVGRKSEEMHFLITTLSRHSDALSWNVLIFLEDASSVFLFFFNWRDGSTWSSRCSCLLTQAEWPAPLGSSFLFPYRVTFSPAGHCRPQRKKGDRAQNKVEFLEGLCRRDVFWPPTRGSDGWWERPLRATCWFSSSWPWWDQWHWIGGT